MSFAQYSKPFGTRPVAWAPNGTNTGARGIAGHACSPTMSSQAELAEPRPLRAKMISPPTGGGDIQISLEELVRDEDVWFKDGTVVIVARQTAFKYYKGLLMVHSTVFSDVFSFATFADEEYDDAPVLRLSDPPEDVKLLLTHLAQLKDRLRWVLFCLLLQGPVAHRLPHILAFTTLIIRSSLSSSPWRVSRTSTKSPPSSSK